MCIRVYEGRERGRERERERWKKKKRDTNNEAHAIRTRTHTKTARRNTQPVLWCWVQDAEAGIHRVTSGNLDSFRYGGGGGVHDRLHREE